MVMKKKGHYSHCKRSLSIQSRVVIDDEYNCEICAMHCVHRYYCLLVLKILAKPLWQFTIGHLLLCAYQFSTSAVYSALLNIQLPYASILYSVIIMTIYYNCQMTNSCRPGAAQAVGSVLQRYGQPGLTSDEVANAFNQIQWTQQQVNNLENDLLNGNAFTFCFSRDWVCIQVC